MHWRYTGKIDLCYMPGRKLIRKHLQGFFRARTGGRTHRCEFTDKIEGALHGGKKGAFMDAYFEKFLENISEHER